MRGPDGPPVRGEVADRSLDRPSMRGHRQVDLAGDDDQRQRQRHDRDLADVEADEEQVGRREEVRRARAEDERGDEHERRGRSPSAPALRPAAVRRSDGDRSAASSRHAGAPPPVRRLRATRRRQHRSKRDGREQQGAGDGLVPERRDLGGDERLVDGVQQQRRRARRRRPCRCRRRSPRRRRRPRRRRAARSRCRRSTSTVRELGRGTARRPSPASAPLTTNAVKTRRPTGMPASAAASGLEPIAYRSRPAAEGAHRVADHARRRR